MPPVVDDLDALTDWFPSSDWPAPVCPACGSGSLNAVAQTTHETAASQDARGHDAWEPEWISGYFTAELRCGRSRCREVVVAAGEVRVRFIGGDPSDGYVEEFRLRFTAPALPIIAVPEECPEDVAGRVVEAGFLIWADPSAAANRLRLTTEQILDHQGVPRSTRNAKGKDVALKTHDRIELFRKNNPGVAEVLEAVKWIGNQGSHEDVLTQRDVLEGGRMLEHALRRLYDRSTDEIARRVQAINETNRKSRAQ